MKKCARCDAEYDDAYDGCPACAKAVIPRSPASAGTPSGFEMISLIASLLCVGIGLLLYFGGSNDAVGAIRWIGAGLVVGIPSWVARGVREGRK